MSITIFTDGSSRGNPGPGGWGVIINYPERSRGTEKMMVKELGGREARTTNNKMELMAALEALTFVKSLQEEVEEILIYTDSSYMINGITKWVKGWAKNGWLTSQDEPVVNDDVWKNLVAVVEKLEEESNINWTHIKGHAGIPGNERVDEIATAFADKEDIKLYNGSRKEYSVDLESIAPSKVEETVSIEKKARARQKAYSYLSLVDGKIERHTSWADCERRVRGVSGAKFKKAISLADEQAIIKEWQK